MSTDIGQQAARGVLVTLASRWGNTLTMLASSVVLARLLSPTDFGIVAMVTAITGFAVLFQDLGLTSAAVRIQSLERSQQTTLFLLNILLGASLTAVVFFSAPLIADFYNQPEVGGVARILSFTFVITSLAGQARADLLRDLRFGVIAAAQIIIGILQFIVALVFALNGAGYWAIVAGSIASSVCWAGTLLSKSNFRPVRPARFRSVRAIVVQGMQITVIQSTTYLSRNLDVIAVGRFNGSETVGLYNRASQTVGLVEQQLTAALTAVALPTLSKLQDETEKFQAAVERSVRLIGYSLTPLFTTLSLFAVPAVTLVYGQQWTEAGHILVILALAGTVRSVFLLVELAATALGNMGSQITASLSTQIGTAMALVIAAYHGIYAVAITYVIATFLSVGISVWWVCRNSRINFIPIVRVFSLPAGIWAVSYGVASLVKHFAGFRSMWLSSTVAAAVQLLIAGLFLAVSKSARADVAQVVGMVKLAFRK